MKCIVIYYSQSGNTKLIAEGVQRGVVQRNQQCDIARIKDVRPEELGNYDLIGIGSPVWYCEPTPNILTFIKNIPAALKGKHFFYFCTHGTYPGQCIWVGVKVFQQQGLTLIGWNDWYGDVFLAGHARPYFTGGHPDAIDASEAAAFGSTMVENSLKISQGATGLIPTLPEGKDYIEIYGVSHLSLGSGTRANMKPEEFPIPLRGELRINADKCAGCRLCAENCIGNNIDSSVSPPVFKSRNCEKCLYCEGICPTGAIEYDFPPPELNFGSQKFFQKNLAEAEAKGRFRRLVREEDIGWNTPWEKATGHPRLRVP